MTYVPLDEVATPMGGLLIHYVDYWCAVDPERGLILYAGRLQGNSNRVIAQRIQERLYPEAETRKLAHVFLPHECDRE